MKYLLLLPILFLFSCKTIEHSKKASPDLLEYNQVFEYPDKTKDQLYNSINSWAVDVFLDADAVIQYSDKESGKIKGKYVSSLTLSVYYYKIRSTIDIDIKDGKYRLRFFDPMYRSAGDKVGNRDVGAPFEPFDKVNGLDQIRLTWDDLALSLQEHIELNAEW